MIFDWIARSDLRTYTVVFLVWFSAFICIIGVGILVAYIMGLE